MADFLCTSCGKTFSRKAALQKHFSDVHKQENCECKECGKILRSKKQLANHLFSHEKITCGVCEKILNKHSKSTYDCGEISETLK